MFFTTYPLLCGSKTESTNENKRKRAQGAKRNMRGKCFYDNKYIDIDGARAEYKTMVIRVAQK